MASEAEGTLSIAYTELGPPRFLPKLNGSPQASINMTTVYESPWHNDPKGNIMPRLFKSWSDPTMAWYGHFKSRKVSNSTKARGR
jgi:hypothetical protein